MKRVNRFFEYLQNYDTSLNLIQRKSALKCAGYAQIRCEKNIRVWIEGERGGSGLLLEEEIDS